MAAGAFDYVNESFFRTASGVKAPKQLCGEKIVAT